MTLINSEWRNHALESAGAADAYRPVLLDESGLLDASFLAGIIPTFSRVRVDDSSHYIDTSSSGALQFTSSRVSMDDSTTVALGYTISFLIVIDATNGNIGAFFLQGGVNAVQELFDPSTVFTTTKDSATSFNVYYEASNYYLQNKRTATKSVTLYTFAG